MNKKHKKVWTILSYILGSINSGCVSISAFTSQVIFPVGITSSAIGLNF